jgi:type II secretory pathway pseudopilin PulG
MNKARRRQGFTLTETVVAMGVLGLVCTSLIGAATMAFRMLQFTRESQRATQILAQKMEVVRLCNWSQTNPTNTFLPTTLTVPYYTDGVSLTNTPLYTLQVTINNAPVGASYSNDVRMIKLKATWTSCGLSRTQSMTTYVSEWGMQNYVW